jgi:hypothetical protein
MQKIHDSVAGLSAALQNIGIDKILNYWRAGGADLNTA